MITRAQRRLNQNNNRNTPSTAQAYRQVEQRAQRGGRNSQMGAGLVRPPRNVPVQRDIRQYRP